MAVVAYANGRDAVNANVKQYAAATRAILLQHGSLGGFADGVIWESEDYDQGPSDAERTLAVAALTFTIHVADVVNKWAGPKVPSPPDPDVPPDPDTIPGSEWPIVEETFIEVDREEELA